MTRMPVSGGSQPFRTFQHLESRSDIELPQEKRKVVAQLGRAELPVVSGESEKSVIHHWHLRLPVRMRLAFCATVCAYQFDMRNMGKHGHQVIAGRSIASEDTVRP
jgi:hypothetical protein